MNDVCLLWSAFRWESKKHAYTSADPRQGSPVPLVVCFSFLLTVDNINYLNQLKEKASLNKIKVKAWKSHSCWVRATFSLSVEKKNRKLITL